MATLHGNMLVVNLFVSDTLYVVSFAWNKCKVPCIGKQVQNGSGVSKIVKAILAINQRYDEHKPQQTTKRGIGTREKHVSYLNVSNHGKYSRFGLVM